MLKSFRGILLPLIIIILAFLFAGPVVGFFVFAVLLIYTIYKYLPDIYLLIGKTYYLKDNNKMFAFFEKAYKTGRMKPDHKIYYAYMCMREGRMEKAERLFNAVLAYKQEPEIMARARTNYALFLWKKGNLDEALELTEQVFKTYKSSVVYGNYGYLLIMKGNLQKALEVNLEAYDYDDTNHVIADNLGQNYYLLGEYEKSRDIFEKLMQQEPRFPIPYYNFAKTLYALGEKEEAVQKLKTALGCQFSSVAEISKEEVEGFMLKIEDELNKG